MRIFSSIEMTIKDKNRLKRDGDSNIAPLFILYATADDFVIVPKSQGKQDIVP